MSILPISSIFIILLDFLTFLCYKETNAVSFQSQIDPSEKTAFKKPTLIRFKECQVCLCEKILSDTLREPRSVDFFPIWKYQEEIYSTLPKKLVLNRGFWSLLWKLLIMYFPDIFHTFLNMALLLVTWCNYAAQLHLSLHICGLYICKSSSH